MSAPAFLSGWMGRHSALDPAGPQAERIGDLWWLMFWVCTAVFLAVLAALLLALLRGRRGDDEEDALRGLLVVAEPPESFAAWLEAQRRPAVPPATPAQLRGQKLVETLPCALCHTIQGTQASGKTGPDLTHLASRRTLAAGTLPNTPGHLAGWIVDPQSIKPGNHMPANTLRSEDLQALLANLGSLK